jgi:hypothetical protein
MLDVKEVLPRRRGGYQNRSPATAALPPFHLLAAWKKVIGSGSRRCGLFFGIQKIHDR